MWCFQALQPLFSKVILSYTKLLGAARLKDRLFVSLFTDKSAPFTDNPLIPT